MIKVTCEVKTYNEPMKPSLKVHNHWNQRDYVELEVDGERFVIKGNELKEAINNCMNTARF